MNAIEVLFIAAKLNIAGKLVGKYRSGMEAREYKINGRVYRVTAWPGEHTISEEK